MTTMQTLGMAVVGVALVTTVSLPDRVFYKVIDALRRLIQGTLGVAMGTIKSAA